MHNRLQSFVLTFSYVALRNDSGDIHSSRSFTRNLDVKEASSAAATLASSPILSFHETSYVSADARTTPQRFDESFPYLRLAWKCHNWRKNGVNVELNGATRWVVGHPRTVKGLVNSSVFLHSSISFLLLLRVSLFFRPRKTSFCASQFLVAPRLLLRGLSREFSSRGYH